MRSPARSGQRSPLRADLPDDRHVLDRRSWGGALQGLWLIVAARTERGSSPGRLRILRETRVIVTVRDPRWRGGRVAGDKPEQLQIRLDDDTGSETLSRYTFQEVLAAEVVVEMLAGKPIRRVLCESDEDYVIEWTDERPEFVSVKHREPDQGEWTCSTLCSDGGVRHLFNTWKKAGKRIRCRLQTNAGLKTGESEARRLAVACRDEDTATLKMYLADLKTKLSADSEEEVEAFLADLRIQDSLPKRDDLRPRVLDTLQDQMTSIGWARDRHSARFDLVCSEVHKASSADLRSHARVPSAEVPNAAAIKAQALAAKTVDADRILAALRNAEQASQRQGPSLLEQKLDCGGIGPTGIRRAAALQEHWLRTRYRWSSDLPGDTIDELRRRVLKCADIAERESRDTKKYGSAMQARLESLLASEAAAGVPAYIDEDALLGIAYDETDRCNVVWCEDFVPKAMT
jgi:hypothetical protein